MDRKNEAKENEKLGKVAMEANDYLEGILQFSEAIALNPLKASLWNRRCACLMALKRSDLALNDALKAIELDETLKSAHFRLIECHLNLGEIEKAENAIKKLQEIDSDALLTDLVKKMKKLKKFNADIDKAVVNNNFDKCFGLLDEAMKLSPDSNDLKFKKLQILVISGRFQKIDEKMNQSGMLEVLKRFYEGNIHESLRLLETVKPMLRTSKEVESFKEKLINFADVIAKAEKLASKKNFLQAAETLEALIDVDHLNKQLRKDLHYKIAKIYSYHKIDFTKANEFADKALELDKNFHEAILLKAKCQIMLKAPHLAIVACDSIIESTAPKEMKDLADKLKQQIEEGDLSTDDEAQNDEEGNSSSEEFCFNDQRFDENEFGDSDDTSNDDTKEKLEEDIATDISTDSDDDIADDQKSPEEFLPKPSSTAYSFNSADTKTDPKFKEFIGRPKRDFQESQNMQKAEEKFKQGCRDYKSKFYQHAIKLFTEAITLAPNIAGYYLSRADCYFRLQNFESGSVDSLKAIELEPGNWKAYASVVNSFLMLGNVNQAENYLEKYQNNVTGVSSMKFNEIPKVQSLKQLDENITRMYQEQNFEECLKNIRKALQIAKLCVKYHNLAIECLIILEQCDEADGLINKTLAMNPRDAQMIFYQGFKFYHKREFETSMKFFETCLRIDPDMTKAHEYRTKAREIWKFYETGSKEYKAENYKAATAAFESALKVDEVNNARTRFLLYYNIGSSNFNLENFSETILNFNQALRLDEKHVKSLTKRAESHFKLKEFEDCLIDFEEIMKLEPSENVKKLMAEATLFIANKPKTNKYELLGIKMDATEAEIKKAYHKLSLNLHPDKNPHAAPLEAKKLDRKFREVSNAYNFALSLCNRGKFHAMKNLFGGRKI